MLVPLALLEVIDSCHRLKPFSAKIANFDHKNDFCKTCIGGFGLFVAILICLYFIYFFYVE